MGLCHSKQENLKKIVYLSGHNLSLDDLNDILNSTTFTEEELLQLYYRYYQLDVEEKGAISNYQLLELNELKLSPFRPRLLYALGLRTSFDQEERKQERGSLNRRKTITSADVQGQGIGGFFFAREARQKLFKKDVGGVNSYALRVDFKDYSEATLSTPYINFKEFVNYISVLSPKASLEAKAKLMFKIFDFDGDGFLNRDDLMKGLGLLLEGSTILGPDVEMIADKIIAECDTKNKSLVDFEDFVSAMFNSDLEKNCTIYF
eukprot:TRINITY_DN24507_c0_g1_i1.p1 TRINITY_DN24507_c0_g1~~TRINITY_DN24507_c0_g1_i1.p1  ORF type:complete len:262 (+),score=56.43 TRINITY_DN24507_c0_g1_i1:113-898(+)